MKRNPEPTANLPSTADDDVMDNVRLQHSLSNPWRSEQTEHNGSDNYTSSVETQGEAVSFDHDHDDTDENVISPIIIQPIRNWDRLKKELSGQYNSTNISCHI